MGELEHLWSDDDRRDAALERLLTRVEHACAELEPSEVLVLKALSHGLTEAEAAEVLGWSKDTVHDRAARARLVRCAKSTLHAVAIALRRGLIS